MLDSDRFPFLTDIKVKQLIFNQRILTCIVCLQLVCSELDAETQMSLFPFDDEYEPYEVVVIGK